MDFSEGPEGTDEFCRPMTSPKMFRRLFTIIWILLILDALLISLISIDVFTKIIMFLALTLPVCVLLLIFKWITSGSICITEDMLEVRRFLSRQSIPIRYIKTARKTTFDEAQMGLKIIKDDTPALYVDFNPDTSLLFKIKYGLIFRSYLILPTKHADQLAEAIKKHPIQQARRERVIEKKVKKTKHKKLKIAILLMYSILIIGAVIFVMDAQGNQYFEFFEITKTIHDNESQYLFHLKYVNVDRNRNQIAFRWGIFDPYDGAAWDRNGPIKVNTTEHYVLVTYPKMVTKNGSYEFWFSFKKNETDGEVVFDTPVQVKEYRISIVYLNPINLSLIEPPAQEIIYNENLTLKWHVVDLEGSVHEVEAKRALNYTGPINWDFRLSDKPNPIIEDARMKYLTASNPVLKSIYRANYYAHLREENRRYIEEKLLDMSFLAIGLLFIVLVWFTISFKEHIGKILPIYPLAFFPNILVAAFGQESLYILMLPYSVAMIALLYSNFSRKNINIFEAIEAPTRIKRLLLTLAVSILIIFLLNALLNNELSFSFAKHALFYLLLPALLFSANVYINREMINREWLTLTMKKIREIEGSLDGDFILPNLFAKEVIHVGKKAKSYRFDQDGNVYTSLYAEPPSTTIDYRGRFNTLIMTFLILIFFAMWVFMGTFGISEYFLSLMLFSIILAMSFRI